MEYKWEDRFWSYVDQRKADECWPWTGSFKSHGYGSFTIDGVSYRASRLAYQLRFGDPGDKWVLHTCDSPSCVNPKHLYLGDRNDNTKDKLKRNRQVRGETHPRAKLTNEEVGYIKRNPYGQSCTHMAKEFGVSAATIEQIRKGLIWKGVETHSEQTLAERGWRSFHMVLTEEDLARVDAIKSKQGIKSNAKAVKWALAHCDVESC